MTALAWYALSATITIALVLLLFGDEPDRLNSGRPNPLNYIGLWFGLIALAGAVPFVLVLVRRPRIGANHYALTVRPTWIRTLRLPWAGVGGITVLAVHGEWFLLVRCQIAGERIGDVPRWVDQGIRRALIRDGAMLARRFDLAIRMRDFVGAPDAQLAALAAFAPDHVTITQHERPQPT